jgi:hypothetical protein
MPSADDIETNIMTRLSNAAPADLVNDARIDADTQRRCCGCSAASSAIACGRCC